MTACRTALDERRWHFQHGPIDLVLEADGDPRCVAASHEAAWCRFRHVLDELVADLPALRRAVGASCDVRGPVARRMWRACHPHRERFVTSMAAVAGAVADELIASYRRPGVARAWINNGGDIALHLDDGRSVRVGLVSDPTSLAFVGAARGLAADGCFVVTSAMPVRGVATSGWRGRSLSLGIADSVTVLAADAAGADAAATMIANAVDVPDPRIVRRPACDVVDDSDLGARLVTVDVPPLGDAAVRRALSSGLEHADALRRAGRIVACVLVCQGRAAVTAPHEGAIVATPGAVWHAPRLNTPSPHVPTEAVA